MAELLFKVDDHVRVRPGYPPVNIYNKNTRRSHRANLAGNRGRVVQVNPNNFNGEHYSVRVTGCKTPVWLRAEDLERVSPLDRLAEIQ